jgi:hypothetical protein
MKLLKTIAIVVGADMLRCKLDPVPEVARGLQLESLCNEVHDLADVLRQAIAARPEAQRLLLNAVGVCAPDGFWLPLTVEIAGLTIEEGRDARDGLFDALILQAWGRLEAGGGFGAAQETESTLPGAGQPERTGLLLLAMGPSCAQTA